MKKIEFLPENNFQVLKIIKIEGPKWNYFSGFIPYLRKYNPVEYDSEKGDILDENLLSTIKEHFNVLSLYRNCGIFFKGQIEEELKMIEGGVKKKITIVFTPLIPFETAPILVGREFSEYPIVFNLRLHYIENSEKIDQIHDFLRCYIPFEIIDEKIKTIKLIS